MGRSLWRCAALLSVAVAAACDPVALEDTRDEIDIQRSIWAAASTTSYRYTLTRICFCGDFGSFRIEVRDGAVASVTRLADGESMTLSEWFLTIDGLFQLVDDALNGGAAHIEVLYDPDRGFPSDVDIDYIANAIDDELQLLAGDYEPLS